MVAFYLDKTFFYDPKIFTWENICHQRFFTWLLIYLSFFADLTWAYLALSFYFFRGRLAACTKSDRPTEIINPVNFDYFACHLWALLHLFSVYIAVIIHILHDKKTNFIENCCFCKRMKPKIICNPDLIFGLVEHLITLTLFMALPLYYLDKMCHPDLTFWPALLFGTCVTFNI